MKNHFPPGAWWCMWSQIEFCLINGTVHISVIRKTCNGNLKLALWERFYSDTKFGHKHKLIKPLTWEDSDRSAAFRKDIFIKKWLTPETPCYMTDTKISSRSSGLMKTIKRDSRWASSASLEQSCGVMVEYSDCTDYSSYTCFWGLFKCLKFGQDLGLWPLPKYPSMQTFKPQTCSLLFCYTLMNVALVHSNVPVKGNATCSPWKRHYHVILSCRGVHK